MVQFTLYSNTLMGKYVMIYAYDSNRASINASEVLYDHDVPCFNLHLSKEHRKNLKLYVPSTGFFQLMFSSQHQGGMQFGISMRITRLIEGNPGILMDTTGNSAEVVKEISLTAFSDSILMEFIQAAKTYVENMLSTLATTEGSVTRYMYNARYGEWEMLNTSPKRTLESVFIPDDDKTKIVNHVQRFVCPDTHNDYIEYGVPYKSNILLYGPPGTGKTSTVQAIASNINSDVCLLTFTNELDDSGLVRAINNMHSLKRARILVLEDIDCLFEDRKEHDTQRNAVTLSGLLNCMDGLMRAEGILVFLTANHVNALDGAFLRPGRIDLAVAYKAPMSRNQVRAMFQYYAPTQCNDTTFAKLYEPVQYKENLIPSLLQGWFFHFRQAPDITQHVPDLLAWLASANTLQKGGESCGQKKGDNMYN